MQKIFNILSLLVLGSLAHAAPVKVGVKAGVFDGIINAGPVVQLLLLLLIGLSVVSWTIILTKFRQLRTVQSSNATFLTKFWQAPSLEALNDRIKEFPNSSIARVFKAAFQELQKIAESGLAPKDLKSDQVSQLRGLDNVERALRKAIDSEIVICESNLGFLATTGSTSPFIGLLGTVIGIMTSFSGIASTGSANLAVVAPGISEALFSTAIGLVAALPAVAAYNFFINKVKRIEMDMNSFASDFLNISKRNFFHED